MPLQDLSGTTGARKAYNTIPGINAHLLCRWQHCSAQASRSCFTVRFYLSKKMATAILTTDKVLCYPYLCTAESSVVRSAWVALLILHKKRVTLVGFVGSPCGIPQSRDPCIFFYMLSFVHQCVVAFEVIPVYHRVVFLKTDIS